MPAALCWWAKNNNNYNNGSLKASTFDFLHEVGHCLTASSGDLRVTSFLFQCLSVLIQRSNSALTLVSFISTDKDLNL